jgi:hypothetical protein
MVRPDPQKWNQTTDDLRRLATGSPHPRTRERFLALYMIASEQTNATRWAEAVGREDESVLNWAHRYNERGPDALTYRRTGGCAPLLRRPRPRRSSRRQRPAITTCPGMGGR